jgi:uncharacterized protein (DUF58 family)
MRRLETLLTLLAVVLASLAALQIPGRVLLALIAIAILLCVGVLRLRSSLRARRNRKPVFDPYERAARIREERHRRTDR